MVPGQKAAVGGLGRLRDRLPPLRRYFYDPATPAGRVSGARRLRASVGALDIIPAGVAVVKDLHLVVNRKAGATGAARAVVICENHASRWLQPGSHPRVDHRVAAGFICWA